MLANWMFFWNVNDWTPPTPPSPDQVQFIAGTGYGHAISDSPQGRARLIWRFVDALALVGLMLVASATAHAQSIPSNVTGMHVLGASVAQEYGKWSALSLSTVIATGSRQVNIEPASFTVPAGMSISPIGTNIPIHIDDGAQSETIKPTAVNCSSGSGICQFTATFVNVHPNLFRISSGSKGLQEAIESQHGSGGGLIQITPDWSGSTSFISAATGYTNVSLQDTRAGNVIYYTWNGSNYVVAWDLSSGGGGGTTFLPLPMTNILAFNIVQLR